MSDHKLNDKIEKVVLDYIRLHYPECDINYLDDLFVEITLKNRTIYLYLLINNNTSRIWTLPSNYIKKDNHYVLCISYVRGEPRIVFIKSTDGIQKSYDKSSKLWKLKQCKQVEG